MQYEISNFAKPSFECRHNTDCWQRREYVGIGCAACGFLGNVRYKNPDSLSRYLRGDKPETTVLSKEDARFESVMLGLRMNKGVSDAAFCAMHGMTLREAFGAKLDGPIKNGLLTFEGGALRLTRRGMDVQNSVLVELM
jgi:oxygen-independent coproporphyrinogen-3 oxidase